MGRHRMSKIVIDGLPKLSKPPGCPAIRLEPRIQDRSLKIIIRKATNYPYAYVKRLYRRKSKITKSILPADQLRASIYTQREDIRLFRALPREKFKGP